MRAVGTAVESAVQSSDDRLGASYVPTRLISWLTFDNNGVNSDLISSAAIPAGTLMVEIVATGGGGNGDGVYAGGAGGGSVEYRFAPDAEGLSIGYKINRPAQYSGNNPTPDVTVTLPMGFGTMIAAGGRSSVGDAQGANGGSGSGPPGSIVRIGGGATTTGGLDGQGPFGGRRGASGGGGAGPFGGDGGIGPGGGANYQQSATLSGTLSIKFYGEPLP